MVPILACPENLDLEAGESPLRQLINSALVFLHHNRRLLPPAHTVPQCFLTSAVIVDNLSAIPRRNHTVVSKHLQLGARPV